MKGNMMHYPLTTNAIIDYANRVFPHKEIISKLPDGSTHRYTYAEMYKRTKKLSSALVSKLGVKPGDKIATLAWNHYQHLELYYAIPGTGAICHTLNIRLSPDQISYIINHAEDKIIFTDATTVPILEKIASSISGIRHFIIINAAEGFQTTLPNTILYEDLVNLGADTYEWHEVEETDACGLCYTSGTTGDPKGALYSHRSTYLHAMAIMMPNATNISAMDKTLLIVPQFHVMAWGYPFHCILAGSDIVMPSLHLQPEAIIDIIQKEKVTVANGIPTIWMGVYEALKKNPPKEKLTLKECVIGGSALPVSLMEAFEKDFGVRIIHAWGMTETSPLGTISRLQTSHEQLSPSEKLKVRAKQGVEMPGIELRAITSEGVEAPRDGITPGEFEVKGVWVINSYFGSTDNESFTDDGWFKTGDVGTIDKHGYMMITDRVKDIIKSGGEWISSVAVENALMAHPMIKEAAVIGIPDEKWGERPLVCMVCDENHVVPDEELKKFLTKDFVNYQIPDQFITLKEIPKTSVGKFNKKQIRKLHAEGNLK